MANRDLVAIGASAGGVEALVSLCRRLPAHFPATILITQHLPSHYASNLDQLLSWAGPLPATFAHDGDALKKEQIFLAPPGCHLIADRDRLLLGKGPRENNARPAIDPMLRSVAVCCGPRAIGVVVTGTLGDGASGLKAVQQCGGISVVQDPALEERIALTEKLRKQASDRGHNKSTDDWSRKIEEIEKETDTLRKTITRIDEVIDRAA
jgi:two-component system chemotaxis response regulator CheB